MIPFVTVEGIAAPLLQANIDTDQITPGHTGMKVQKSGFAAGLFFNWRYLADGSANPSFVLNQPAYRGACFVVAGANFGCGSSREFAVWALRDFGIRAVLAPSFGAIFTANCYTNGLLPVTLPEQDIAAIAVAITPENPHLSVSLQNTVVVLPDGRAYPFKVPALQRERLLEGLDPIDHTRKRESLIAAFQEKDAALHPWVYWH
jgi:3-isopropylmalate/(R)-2-methylmalate dehydratase small subunit